MEKKTLRIERVESSASDAHHIMLNLNVYESLSAASFLGSGQEAGI